MVNLAGELVDGPLRLDFDRWVKLEFHGCRITSDVGLLAYRELDDALDLTVTAGKTLADGRTGKNGRHQLDKLLQQSVFGKLTHYGDVNDAEQLHHDPAMRWIVCGKATSAATASPSQMWRFKTKWLARLTISRLLSSFLVNGSTGFMAGGHQRASCSTWI